MKFSVDLRDILKQKETKKQKEKLAIDFKKSKRKNVLNFIS